MASDYDEDGSKKQPRLTKQQADILQTKYFEWGGTLRNVSERELIELSQAFSLKVTLDARHFTTTTATP